MSLENCIRTTYSKLKEQNDLAPNSVINKLLTDFVHELSTAQENGNTEVADCKYLQQERLDLPILCGQAECEMEKYWAREFLKKQDLTPESLKEFWYYENYAALWETEHNLMSPYLKNKRLVFLGSGALPLTIILASLNSAYFKAVCVDYDSEAVTLSSSLIEHLNLQEQIQVICCRAQNFSLLEDDFVMCASLINGKSELYDRLSKKNVTHFVVRDVEGCYCYLYHPSYKPRGQQFKEIAHTLPNKTCINTTRLYEKTTTH